MAEGLKLLGSCPRCHGELRFADHAATAPAAAKDAAAEVAPHLVLGLPRLPY